MFADSGYLLIYIFFIDHKEMGASITKRDSSVFVSGENINKSDIHIKKQGFCRFHYKYKIYNLS